MLLFFALLASTPAATVAEAYPPPPGAERVEADSFGRYLQALELHPADRPIRTHAGRTVAHDGRAVVLPLVSGDLQQCADSILRLRAEYLRAQGLGPSFHATSGDPIPWARYAGGERARAVDDRLQWSAGAPADWDAWLTAVFTWAGTASLEAYDTVPDDTPHPGDVLVEGGFPGHAVLLLDVARRGDDTFVLVGEGFMPAQDFHVEHGPQAGWWPWDDGVALPHWTLPASTLRTWPGGEI